MAIENNPADLVSPEKTADTAGEVEGLSEDAEKVVRMLISERGHRGAIEQVKGLDRESQALAAESYFKQMTGDREMPMAGSNREQYEVYMALKGSAFSNKFSELEDARLKKFGYGGFAL